ncbi:hypothetical protein [Dysgonomonas sp. ZJ709]|uniref:hypothetical protein n=1 Tax=Dysgonomonas sp. ZJ709 TaxID=2709797 RepID=UPI0013EC84DF|nr:hypothetical protein [Dysgonomonas sp. ZJ709]
MNKEIIYTESALKKINTITDDFKKKIEAEIINSKNFLGEESIEITAADIEEIYKQVRIGQSISNKLVYKNRMMRIILPIYFFIGVFMIIFGLFYDNIQNMIHENPPQLMIILSGFILSLVSGALYLLVKQRIADRINREKYEDKIENSEIKL